MPIRKVSKIAIKNLTKTVNLPYAITFNGLFSNWVTRSLTELIV